MATAEEIRTALLAREAAARAAEKALAEAKAAAAAMELPSVHTLPDGAE